ncbi:ParA family protein [Proteiniclasticum ruminis]|uniref:Sporulation initiation inhibitor protein Soj n=1 Tax=Proteiniclasticum ruminis TaxID=398199 RepID=A0A1G8L8X5_9CLOT|nr:ParA family protein [Proteiniclasticum ruminis]MBP9920657.1 ParA family protein [Proteiniclasticum sp.]SDI52138.1 chromosome partitioning protein [Proteiniclasticum ruminis]
MKIVSIFNQKGGVGKTTTNINLAAYIALQGHKVLVIDIDPQGNSSSGLGVDKDNIENTTYELLVGETDINDTVISLENIENLKIIPSNMNLAGADLELSYMENRESILKTKLGLLEESFDFIIIDCPPSLGLLTINALTASDSVLIPMQCEYYALEGISQLVKTIQKVKKGLNKNLEIEGVVLTMFDPRRNLQIQVAEELKSYFGELVYESSIPRNIRLAESPSFGMPIALYDPRAKGAEAYEDLANEFLRKQKGGN